MKVILFLFLSLPFLWQCKVSDDFFESANLVNTTLSREPTTKLYSIHSDFDSANIASSETVTTAYTAPTIDELTDENYVLYGQIYGNRDINVTSLSGSQVWILFEIRKDSRGNIKVNSANTSRPDLYTPLDLYNARTELPTVVKSVPNKTSIGVWPKYSEITHGNLATTNTSQFNYVNPLQSGLYTNIESEVSSNSLFRASASAGDLGNSINSSASIAELKTIVSGKVWNSIKYPDSFSPVTGGNNWYFFNDSTLNTTVTTTPPSSTPPASPNYYGWDIWTFDYGFDKDKGPVTDHYLYIYRELLFVSKVFSTTLSGEEQDLFKLVFTPPPLPDGHSPNAVYGNLIKLSITP